MQTLKKFEFKEKRVLVRCDFNVPIINKEISDNFKIQQTFPTIKYLIKKEAKIILISHLGRPGFWLSQRNSKLQITNSNLKQYSLKSVAKRLEKLLKRRVFFIDDCIGEKVKKEIEKLKSGEIILLENLRFYKEEEENNKNFAKELADLADIYINDAFGASHRAHASIIGISKFLPSAAGFLLEKEIKVLKKIIKNPKLPLIAIFGGREGNFKAIDKISEKADFILINWLIEKEIREKKIKLKYPKKIIKTIDGLKGNLDIGEKTIFIFKEKIFQAKTIFWSGPLGQIETEEFSKGTKEIAQVIIKSRAFSVVGGGETIEFINRLGLIKKFNHISTGGSAMLEFVAGEKLPGIEVLKQWK
jgi:3-phosphoglycerate kinase